MPILQQIIYFTYLKISVPVQKGGHPYQGSLILELEGTLQ